MPKNICTVSIKDGKAYFRHPLLKDKSGRRHLAIQRGVGSLTPEDLGRFEADLNQLLLMKPRTRLESPTLKSALAVELYFEPLEKNPRDLPVSISLRETKRAGPKERRIEKKLGLPKGQLGGETEIVLGGMGGPWSNEEIAAAFSLPLPEARSKLVQALQRVSLLEDQVNKLVRERDAYKDRLEGLEQRVGEQNQTERDMPLSACLEHFEARFKAKSEPETKEALRRVKQALTPLADKGVRYGALTKQTLLKAVAATKPASGFERAKREAAVRRFCNFLCSTKEDDGLGFRKNPAAGIRPEAVSALQHRKRQEEGIVTLDPRLILAKGKDPYWRAIVAVLGFAGLRLSELARLRWQSLQEDDEVIEVPGKKTSQSLRCMRPFPNVWAYLKEHKASLGRKPAPDELVFLKPDGKTWIVQKGEDGRQEYCPALSSALSSYVGTLGMEAEETALRLRRWWSSTMKARGLGEQERIFGGHTRQTADDFYLDTLQLAKGSKVAALPDKPEQEKGHAK